MNLSAIMKNSVSVRHENDTFLIITGKSKFSNNIIFDKNNNSNKISKNFGFVAFEP